MIISIIKMPTYILAVIRNKISSYRVTAGNTITTQLMIYHDQ